MFLCGFIENYKVNNPYILKEVITILNSLLAFLDQPYVSKDGKKGKIKTNSDCVASLTRDAQIKESFLRIPVIFDAYLETQ